MSAGQEYVRRALRTLLACLLAASLAGAAAPTRPTTAQAAPAAGPTYTVDSSLDEPDSDPLDSQCASMPSGRCTLRAAVMQAYYASGPATIHLPARVYTLTRAGQDDDAI